MLREFSRNIFNDKGIALITVLMVFLVTIIVGTTIMMLGSQSLHTTKIMEDSYKAHLLAWSGLEAVEVAWKDYSLENIDKFTGQVSRVYYVNDGTFTIEEPASYVGYVELSVEEVTGADIQDSYRIISTGVVNGIRKTISSQSTSLTVKSRPDGWHKYDENPTLASRLGDGRWMDTYYYTTCSEDHYRIHLVPPGNEGQTVQVAASSCSGLTQDIEIKFHSFIEGIVIVDRGVLPAVIANADYNDDLRFPINDGDNNKIGFVAHTIFFRDRLGLNQVDDTCESGCFKVAILVIVAENIIFENRIDVLNENQRWAGIGLALPPGLGVSGEKILSEVESGSMGNVDPNRLYGRVYFDQVYVNDSRDNNLSNRAFYFLPDKDTAENNTNDDLILIRRNAIFDSNQLINTGRLIPIRSDSDEFVPMQPDEYIQFIRSGR